MDSGSIVLMALMKQLPKPNTDEDWVTLCSRLHMDAYLFGCWYLWVPKDESGKAVEARRLEPHKVFFNTFRGERAPNYRIRENNGTEIELSMMDVIRSK